MRRFAYVVDVAIENVEVDIVRVAVCDDAKIVSTKNLCTFDLARCTGSIVDTDVTSRSVDDSRNWACGIVHCCGHFDAVPKEAGQRTGRRHCFGSG